MKGWLAAILVICCAATAQAKVWDEGGSLHGVSVSAWAMAADENILASLADYIKGSADVHAVSAAELKQAAEQAAACMATVTETPGIGMKDADPYVMVCLEQGKAAHPWLLSKPLALAEPAAAEPAPAAWDSGRAAPQDYAVVKADKDARASSGRTKLILRIVLATKDGQGKVAPRTDQTGLTREQLAATVIAAAKHHAEATGADMVGVVLDGGYGTAGAGIQLARCDYAPDGKGASGQDAWMWDDLRAAERGLTAEEQREGGYLSLEAAPDGFADPVPAKAPLR
ncbi:MAG: hypothetical protein ACLU98_06830 [Desulfovibrio fairfieldensis]